MDIIIQNLIIAIISGVFYYMVATVFSDKKTEILKIFLVILINICLMYISQIYIVRSYMIIVTFLIAFSNIYFVSKKSFLSVINNTFVTIVVIAVVDVFYGVMIMMLGMPIEVIQSQYFIILIISILSMITSYGILKMFYKKRIKDVISLSGFTNKQKKSILLFIGMTILILLFTTFIISSSIIQINNYILVALIVIYFLYFLVIIRFINTNRNLSDKTNEYEQLKFYTTLVEDLTEDSNKFKHDYRNMLITFSSYLSSKDYIGLDNYFDELMDVNEKLSSNNFSALKGINDSGLKGLLTMKFNQIISENITFELEVHNDVDFSMSTLDLSRVLGVLLDNAKEASMLSEVKIIRVGILNDEDGIAIIIANTFDQPPKMAEIYNRGTSSKGENRGLGLANVKEILDTKYPDISLDTYIEEKYFIQELTF